MSVLAVTPGRGFSFGLGLGFALVASVFAVSGILSVAALGWRVGAFVVSIDEGGGFQRVDLP